MKITPKDYDKLIDRIHGMMEELEELGASSGICSISCHIDGVGWVASHFHTGDPFACNKLAENYMKTDEEDDDGDFFLIRPPDDEPGDAWVNNGPV